MGIFRLLTILLIAWLVYALYKRYVKARSQNLTSKKSKNPEKIVKCEHCATHIPEHEAIIDKERYYCSEEHKRISNNQ